MPVDRVTTDHLEVRRSKTALPEAVVAMLHKPNPAVITTLRRDGQPVSTATWYLWDDGWVLVAMGEGRRRLEHLRGDPGSPVTGKANPGATFYVSADGRRPLNYKSRTLVRGVPSGSACPGR
jgi:hypothetical protein